MNEILDILGTTLWICMSSTIISTMIAVPFSIYIGLSREKWSYQLRPVISSLAGLPPVLAGILIFLLVSNIGPLGFLRWLYTPIAIIMAQTLIVLPVIMASFIPQIQPIKDRFLETSFGLHFSQRDKIIHLIRELKMGLWAAILMGFGRAMAEVGAVMMVGGNIRYKTRVLTTAIVLETNQGNFENAVWMGLLLLLISFSINYYVYFINKAHHYD